MARRVAAFVPEARFVMAGTGDMLPVIIEQAVTAGLAERMHFAGGLDGVEVDRAYRLARVCVMTSVSEPFGLVALESLRAGTPCLIPRGSGAAEVLRAALPVDFWDIEEITNKVVSILRHPVLHAELRRHGLEEVGASRFSLEEPARLTEAAYRRAATLRAARLPAGRGSGEHEAALVGGWG
jgi:glycogen(starch) synthase